MLCVLLSFDFIRMNHSVFQPIDLLLCRIVRIVVAFRFVTSAIDFESFAWINISLVSPLLWNFPEFSTIRIVADEIHDNTNEKTLAREREKKNFAQL